MTVTDAVHDIAFAPNLGRSFHVLAIATKDVRIFKLVPIRCLISTCWLLLYFVVVEKKKRFWTPHAFVMDRVGLKVRLRCGFTAATIIYSHAARPLLRPTKYWMFQLDDVPCNTP